MVYHQFCQAANDWVMCTCGKVFSDGKKLTAFDKLKRHLDKKEE